MRRNIPTQNLGEAISIEDVLSLMTVVFVVFVLFLVPLVNIDRIQLERAVENTYFSNLTKYIAKNGAENIENPYLLAFGLDGFSTLEKSGKEEDWIFAMNSDSSITVIEHNKITGDFVSISVNAHSSIAEYRFGKLNWSEMENIWFATGDTIDYGDNQKSIDMNKDLREFAKENLRLQ